MANPVDEREGSESGRASVREELTQVAGGGEPAQIFMDVRGRGSYKRGNF